MAVILITQSSAHNQQPRLEVQLCCEKMLIFSTAEDLLAEITVEAKVIEHKAALQTV